MLSATHTHSAPPLTGLFLNDGETDYLPLLIDQIAKGIVKTYRQLEPAQAGWTKTANPGICGFCPTGLSWLELTIGFNDTLRNLVNQ